MKRYIIPALISLSLVACENSDHVFDDFEGGTTTYFAYQYPVRTIMLGDGGEVDNTSDNNHAFTVFATTGGSRSSFNFSVQMNVDESLCQNVRFKDGDAIKALPTTHYQIASNTSTYYGKFLSGVEVKLTDAFFADPASLSETYVLPIVMSNPKNVDRIITGTPMVEGATPARTNESQWSVQPLDYTMICLKYVNNWEGYYIVKGTAAELEDGTVLHVKTTSLNSCTYTNKDGITMTLTFSGNDCTISGDASGNGSYVQNSGEVWGQKERGALRLKYTAGGVSYDETLVAQRRGDFAGTIQTYKIDYSE